MRKALWMAAVCLLASIVVAQTTAAPDPVKATLDYRVEWVGLIAQYDALLSRAAERLTNKYREPLKIPSGAIVPASEWCASGQPLRYYIPGVQTPIISAGQEAIASTTNYGSIPHSVQVQEARNELLAIRDRLDSKFAKAYSNWRDATLRSDVTAVVALWDAREELANVAESRDASWTGIGMPYVRKQLVGQVEGVVAQNLMQVPILGLSQNAHMDTLLRSGVGEALTSKATDYLKDSFAERMDKALEKPDKPACTALAETLTTMADKELLDQAYNLRRGLDTPVVYAEVRPGEKNPNISDRFYAYSSANTRIEHYRTSIGLLIAQRDVIGNKLEGWLWRGNLAEPRARLNLRGADAVRACEDEKTLEIVFQGVHYPSAPAPGAGNFGELREKYQKLKKELNDDANPYIEPWFAALARGTAPGASPDDKLHALAAVRLLKMDLVYYMANNFDRSLRDWAIGKLSDKLGDSSAAQALLGPLHAVLSDAVKEYTKGAIESAVDRLAPDQVKALSAKLDTASFGIARNLGVDSRIERVLGTAPELDAMITPPAELAPAFLSTSAGGRAKVELTGEPGVYALVVSRIDTRFDPAQTSRLTKYVMVRSGQTLQDAVDTRLAELQKDAGNGITIKFESVRRQSAGGAQ